MGGLNFIFMSQIEEILHTAYQENLQEYVFNMLDTMQYTHPHMEMRDKVEIAYMRVKNDINMDVYTDIRMGGGGNMH